jgi:hypothetical protein
MKSDEQRTSGICFVNDDLAALLERPNPNFQTAKQHMDKDDVLHCVFSIFIWAEVMGEWRKLHNEELRDLYSSPSIIRIIKSRMMRWAGHVARMGEKRNAYRLLVGKPEGRRPLGRPRRRWVDNIRMDLGEVGWDNVDWIGLAKDRNRWRALVNLVLNLRGL